MGPLRGSSRAGSRPEDVRVKGTIQVAAEDGDYSDQWLRMRHEDEHQPEPPPAESRGSRISARLGLSLQSFKTFRCRPSLRHVPAMALLDVPCSGQAFARRSDQTPLFGRGLRKPESIGAQAGRGAGSPPREAKPGTVPLICSSRRQPPPSHPPFHAPSSAPPAPAPRRRHPPAPREASGSRGDGAQPWPD